MVRISVTRVASAWVAAAADARLAAQAWKAEVDTPAAVQAAVTGNPAAFWASTQR
jgi:hypothetical protein